MFLCSAASGHGITFLCRYSSIQGTEYSRALSKAREWKNISCSTCKFEESSEAPHFSLCLLGLSGLRALVPKGSLALNALAQWEWTWICDPRRAGDGEG